MKSGGESSQKKPKATAVYAVRKQLLLNVRIQSFACKVGSFNAFEAVHDISYFLFI